MVVTSLARGSGALLGLATPSVSRCGRQQQQQQRHRQQRGLASGGGGGKGSPLLVGWQRVLGSSGSSAGPWLVACVLSRAACSKRLSASARRAVASTVADAVAPELDADDTSDLEWRSLWGDTWYPLVFAEFTDKSKPHSVELLGATLVLWRASLQ
ncbi:unnamed protein product [Polarella glacialis]|uniref:Uncharacterized protein n=1 Tax=Polarella glacialis TaxID=89957 RepID=A0A813LGM6_POLGL|nr:unnamed protein product [Polarella glacialis]